MPPPLNHARENPARFLRPGLFLAAALALIALSSFASRQFWRESGLRALQAINEPRIELIASAVRSEINRQDHLPVVLSLDSDVRSALRQPQDEEKLAQVSDKLARIIAEADTHALYIIGRNGIVLAAGSSNPAEVLVGRNLSDRSYFVKAIESGASSYLGVEPVSNRVRYFLTQAIRDAGALLGVALVRIEFDDLESSWERGGERVLVTDPDGVVFLSSDPGFKYRIIGAARTQHIASEAAPASYPGGLTRPIDITALEQRGKNSIVEVRTGERTETSLYQTLALPEFGWTIHRFAGMAEVAADARDGAIIGAAVSALVLLLLLYVVQRQRAYLSVRHAGARLQSEVAERTRELRDANLLLQAEVDERRRTEERLRAAQNELVQAGKLAALGQMSAAIAHEVNQPLAAIRTFMASTKIFLQRGKSDQVVKNLDLIDGLAERVANITNHLKTFARKSEPGNPEPVDVVRAIDGALFLIESRIKAAGVAITREIDADLWVNGYAVQLEQVLLNLIGNAIDAVSAMPRGEITIRAKAADDTVVIAVADNGHGIPAELISRIFDPFVTTKPVGNGLGLGLSISYGIVQDFHGAIRAANRPEGGAEVVIELPRLMSRNVVLMKAAHV
jgi:two-component system C4-dicarboxylate transport sensor histidine kinase DctB